MNRNYPKVLFLSALKPIDDSRMFEKLALSISDLPIQIHIAGQQAQAIPHTEPQIFFHPYSGNRRFLVWQEARKLICDIKPQLVVACSPDLFLIATRLKKRFKFKLVYDIQENYSLNHKFLHGNQSIKNKLATYLFNHSLKISHQQADAVLLAEYVYSEQLKLPKPALVLENKMSDWAFEKLGEKSETNTPSDKLELVFSGTISESHGIFKAIDFAEACNQIQPTRLTIAGFASQLVVSQKVKNYIKNKSFVEVVGLGHLVAHITVLEMANRAHAGLLFYTPNNAFAGKTPTKFFEYLALNKWVLALQAEQFRLSESESIIHLDHAEKPTQALIAKLLSKPPKAENADFLFDSEAFRLLAFKLIFSVPRQE